MQHCMGRQMGVLDFFAQIQPARAQEKQEKKKTSFSPPAAAAGKPALVNATASAISVQTEAHPARSVDDLPARVRAGAMERVRFLRLVETRQKLARCNARDACNYVALNHAAESPALLHKGKHGASALTYSNYRNYKARAKGITDDEALLLRMSDNYCRGVRKRKGAQDFWQIFFAMYFNVNRFPVTVAYDHTCVWMHNHNRDTPLPTLSQVRYQIAKIEPDKLILARQGEAAWRNHCCDFIRRDWTSVSPGECLIGDTRTFDTRVRVWNEEKQTWIPVSPSVTALMDSRSWYIAAYWITTEPVCADTLIDILRLYLHVTGGVPPAIIYFDNGKDYCAQGFATDFEVDGHPHSIFRELGIRLLNSIAYNVRAKTIERAFRDMMQQLDKIFPDYLGSCPGERNLASNYYDKHPDELPSLEQFCSIFAAWLGDYHDRPKAGDIHQGRSPREIWQSHNTKGQLAQLSTERLRQAFYRPEAIRVVGRGPSVKLHGVYYYCDKLTWGARVLLKTDTLDQEHVICYTTDGSLIGEAVTRQRIHAIAGSQEDISALMARQRRQLREARTTIRNLAGEKQIYSPLELLIAPEDAQALTGDKVTSVKGATHNYIHHRLDGVIAPGAPAAAAIQEPEYQESLQDSALENISEILARPQKRSDEININESELANIHKIITHTTEGDDDEY